MCAYLHTQELTCSVRAHHLCPELQTSERAMDPIGIVCCIAFFVALSYVRPASPIRRFMASSSARRSDGTDFPMQPLGALESEFGPLDNCPVIAAGTFGKVLLVRKDFRSSPAMIKVPRSWRQGVRGRAWKHVSVFQVCKCSLYRLFVGTSSLRSGRPRGPIA